jgi:glutamyl-tRNA reductase
VKLLAVGWNFRTAGVELRERLVVPGDRLPATLAELVARFGGEAVVLSTCNRLEIYLADSTARADDVAAFVAETQGVELAAVTRAATVDTNVDAVRHLFRVVASLDSLVVGEGQVAGQVQRAADVAREQAAAGPFLNTLFRQAAVAGKRVRRETGIAHGRVSISSVAVDFIRDVFDRFDDKTVLVIGAGKMGRLTLTQLRNLGVARVLVANRSAERAKELADLCGGGVVPWAGLDDALARADIVLSTTGASEPVVDAGRMAAVSRRRVAGPLVVLDIAVPRDFDPAIHDGDRVFLFNIDDLQRVRERALADRRRHVGPAEAIAAQEAARFVADWERRRHGPTIARLTADFDAKRQAVLDQLLARLNGRLTDADRRSIERAFRLLQNQLLHGPIRALGETAPDDGAPALLDALRRLFRLKD